MDESKIKSDVLQKLIDLMDERMVGDLKGKSPKFMKVETNDPEAAKELIETAAPEMEEGSKDEEDSDMERLKEMYKKLK